jgi:hypothetical protein
MVTLRRVSALLAAALLLQLSHADAQMSHQPNILANGDFELEACSDETCSPWTISGGATLTDDARSASKVITFDNNGELGILQQTVTAAPGSYTLRFRYYEPCEANMHTLMAVSVHKEIVFTRVFSAPEQCGWRLLAKKIKFGQTGPGPILFRVRTMDIDKKAGEFWIDQIELLADE